MLTYSCACVHAHMQRERKGDGEGEIYKMLYETGYIPVIQALGKLKQGGDGQSKANLDNMRLCLKNKNNKRYCCYDVGSAMSLKDPCTKVWLPGSKGWDL